MLIQPNEEDKIKNKLIESLFTLDLGYLEKNTKSISKFLIEEVAKSGKISWWKGNFTISDKNLEKIVSNIGKQEFTASSEKENNESSNKLLTPSPESRLSVTSVTCAKIVNDAIKLVHKDTSKTFKWEERNKIQVSLVNELQNLGDEYLKNNNSKLVEDIAQDLKNNAKSRWFSSRLAIAPSKLEQIVGKIKIIADQNNKFNEEKSLIFADANIDKSALATNLSKFLSENNIDINKIFNPPIGKIISDDKKIKPENIRHITNKQFLKLREMAPESFDKIMFAKGSDAARKR